MIYNNTVQVFFKCYNIYEMNFRRENMKDANYQYINIPVSDVLDNKKFIIPQFQRSVVWKKQRRKDFIANIRNGEPFGTILVRMNNGRYELIDGLQRVSTIRDFVNKPFDYLNENDIDESFVRNIIIEHLNANNLPNDQKYISDLIPKIRQEIFICLKGGLKNYRAISTVMKKFGLADSDKIRDLINECYDCFNREKDISQLRLNAIQYTGPAENIPNIFYNLNTGGVLLSKYETYAALWSTPLFKIDDIPLLDVVKQKYIQLENESDLDVDFDEEELKSKGISLFEFCYGLSGIIRDKNNGFAVLFGENNKSTDPIGFEILSLVLGLNVNKAEGLYDILKDRNSSFLLELKKVILDSLTVISNSLKDTIIGLNKSYLYSDSTYLIYHILISYIRENYFIDVQNEIVNRIDNDLSEKDFKNYLPLYYVYDCITEYWKENRQVSDLQRDLNDDRKRQKYWHNITTTDWDFAVQKLIDSQDTVNKTIPQKNKIFIDFLMKLKRKEQPKFHKYFIDQGEKSYLDFEHIVPKKVVESHIKDLTGPQQKVYPISAIGNLCYLSVKDNRSKRDKTIYEFIDDRPAYTYDEEYLGYVVYPSSAELNFLKYDNVSFRDSYSEFIKNRNNQLAREFLDLIKKYK